MHFNINLTIFINFINIFVHFKFDFSLELDYSLISTRDNVGYFGGGLTVNHLNKTTLVQWPLVTLGQEMRWIVFYSAPEPTREIFDCFTDWMSLVITAFSLTFDVNKCKSRN